MHVNDDALHRSRGVISRAGRSFTAVVLRNDGGPAIWVKENFKGIEPQAISGIEPARNLVGIDLARLHVRYENMPVVIGAIDLGIETDHTRWLAVSFVVKEQKIYA